jgi:uncharacterized protein YecE (DUF72 family)
VHPAKVAERADEARQKSENAAKRLSQRYGIELAAPSWDRDPQTRQLLELERTADLLALVADAVEAEAKAEAKPGHAAAPKAEAKPGDFKPPRKGE